MQGLGLGILVMHFVFRVWFVCLAFSGWLRIQLMVSRV